MAFLKNVGTSLLESYTKHHASQSRLKSDPFDDLIAFVGVELYEKLLNLGQSELLKLDMIHLLKSFIVNLGTGEQEAEHGEGLVEKFLGIITNPNCSFSVITATFSLIPSILLARPNYKQIIVPMLLDLAENSPSQFSESQTKSFLKALKVQLKILSKMHQLGAHSKLVEDTLSTLLNVSDVDESNAMEQPLVSSVSLSQLPSPSFHFLFS